MSEPLNLYMVNGLPIIDHAHRSGCYVFRAFKCDDHYLKALDSGGDIGGQPPPPPTMDTCMMCVYAYQVSVPGLPLLVLPTLLHYN